ncbi:MAG TPA: hypothetical protein VD789_06165, partial [Thermomicrobiales bacterium]|nr:hypothetical protein [Thermomicrobiales bacterium]
LALVIDSLAGLLRVAVVIGDIGGARSLLTEIDERIASRGIVGVEHPGRLFVTLVDAFRWLGEHERAEGALRSGVAVIGERAGWITDPIYRESYVTCVPSHRRILEMASLACIDLAFP